MASSKRRTLILLVHGRCSSRIVFITYAIVLFIIAFTFIKNVETDYYDQLTQSASIYSKFFFGINMWSIYCLLMYTENKIVISSTKSGVVLNRQEYTHCKNQSCSMMIQPKWSIGIHELKWYTTRQLVSCLDAIRANSKSRINKKTHLAFVGDSRIRNQFLNLIQVSVNRFIFLIITGF